MQGLWETRQRRPAPTRLLIPLWGALTGPLGRSGVERNASIPGEMTLPKTPSRGSGWGQDGGRDQRIERWRTELRRGRGAGREMIAGMIGFAYRSASARSWAMRRSMVEVMSMRGVSLSVMSKSSHAGEVVSRRVE